MVFLTYPIDVVGKACPRAERTASGTGHETLVNTATSTDSISIICQMTVWAAPALSVKLHAEEGVILGFGFSCTPTGKIRYIHIPISPINSLSTESGFYGGVSIVGNIFWQWSG